jgi:3-oxoacyl-[acyl-carrier-protein] synthase II
MPRVFVTGAGIITAAGTGTKETFDNVLLLKSGIGRLTLFSSAHSNIPVAEVKYNNAELAAIAGTEDEKKVRSRNALLAIIATDQALKKRKTAFAPDRRTGLVLATTVGGMDLNEKYYKSLLRDSKYRDYIEYFDNGDCAEILAARYGITNNITTVSTACSSSANAIMFAARQISAGKLDRVVTGGTDSLTKFTLNGFNALEILSPDGCRPFDRNRNGLTLGEGAAMLLLESEKTADPDDVICEIKGFANANEAFHQTSSSPEGTGAFLAMKKALSVAGLLPEDIDYINAHGTGTEVNDLAEATAIMRVFEDKILPVSSTKAFTGHTLGAAGAVEAVYSILAIKEQTLLPSLNLTQAMEEITFDIPGIPVKTAIRNVASNSFGFGGNNTTLIFSAV